MRKCSTSLVNSQVKIKNYSEIQISDLSDWQNLGNLIIARMGNNVEPRGAIICWWKISLVQSWRESLERASKTENAHALWIQWFHSQVWILKKVTYALGDIYMSVHCNTICENDIIRNNLIDQQTNEWVNFETVIQCSSFWWWKWLN